MVELGPHRLMLRPHESCDLRLISFDVAIAPAAVPTWSQDVFGNAVATASFLTMTDTLVIESMTRLQLSAWPVLDGTSGADSGVTIEKTI